ncbi:putative ABC-type nitrate transporter [Helianthus anomalus]
MNTFTIEQATLMNRKVANFSIPAGSFSVFLFVSILLFTSLNERITTRLARKITGDCWVNRVRLRVTGQCVIGSRLTDQGQN